MNTRTDELNAEMLNSLTRSRSVFVVVLPLARLLLGAAAVAAIGAAGITGYWLAVGPEGIERLMAPPAEEEVETERLIDIPETIVNLRRDTPSRYLKIGLTLVAAPGRQGAVEEAMPLLVDSMQEFLRNLDQDDLDGSAGLHRLRSELKRRFNLLLVPPGGNGRDVVTDVLLRSLLTQ
ncbi:flagellar basal body-associated FliL family protein [Azospirillum sp. ST 5-10]|uniref:flagellar basal body-associated FliL family protein n=1 Tax=unclassified Azospirillum TaxID=2630922 RepID=UPI003F4A6426